MNKAMQIQQTGMALSLSIRNYWIGVFCCCCRRSRRPITTLMMIGMARNMTVPVATSAV